MYLNALQLEIVMIGLLDEFIGLLLTHLLSVDLSLEGFNILFQCGDLLTLILDPTIYGKLWLPNDLEVFLGDLINVLFGVLHLLLKVYSLTLQHHNLILKRLHFGL